MWDADSFRLAVPVRSHHRFYQGLEAVPGHAFCQPGIGDLLAISFGFMIKVSVTRSAGLFIWLHDQSKCDQICWPFHMAS